MKILQASDKAGIIARNSRNMCGREICVGVVCTLAVNRQNRIVTCKEMLSYGRHEGLFGGWMCGKTDGCRSQYE